MNIDLEQELARAARSVHDDALADRMNGQVRTMVGRIRRRRAARHTAQGVVGIGAVAAVALAGVQLADTPEAPPAGPTDEPTASTAFGECGTPINGPGPGQDLGVTLDGGEVVVADGQSAAQVSVQPRYASSTDVTLGDVRMVATRGGVVVGPVSEPPFVAYSDPPVYTFEHPLDSCDDGAPLPAGTYELYALQDVVLPDSTRTTVLGGPWRFELPTPGSEAGPDDELTAEEHEALMTRNEMMSDPVPNPEGVMPRCGAEAVLDDGSTPLVLDPPLSNGPFEITDGRFEGTITMRTRDGQYVIGNAAGAGATLVLMKEGVVVGYQWLDSEDVTFVDLQPDQTVEIPLRGNALLCGTGEGGTGPGLPLPPDTYQAVAVVDVMLKEVGTPGGQARSVTRTVPVMSEPVEIEIAG